MSLLRSMIAPMATTSESVDPTGFLTSTGGYGRRTVSGERVSPARALSLSTWFACIRDISEDVGMLPLRLFEKQQSGGKKLLIDHRIAELLDQPNPESPSMTVRETMTGWAMSWGNGYAEIERDGSGYPIALWPIHPCRARVHRDEGIVVYDIWSPEYKTDHSVRLYAKDVIHLRGFGDDPLCGLSVARLAAESIGLSLAAQTFGAAFFGNGATLGIVLEHPGKVSPEAMVNLRESWVKIHGGADRSHKPAILEQGMKVNKISVPPEEAQFIETREHQDAEIAKWFRMPLHKVQQMKAATFGNIEHQAMEYVSDCLMPWCRRWESELQFKLLDVRDRRRLEILHDVETRMRGDSQSRANFYRGMISTAAMTPNEARERESLTPYPGAFGDRLFMQGAMSTLERIVEGPPEPVTPPADPEADPAKPEPTPAEDETKQQATAMRPVFDDAEARCRRKEEIAIANARRKFPRADAFGTWAAAFYTEHGAYLIEAMLPAATALANSIRSTLPAYRVDTAALDQVVRDYCSHALRHAVATGSAFTPDKPLAETIIAILTLEVTHA
jgi:HK97 family phage portal protein